jgi:hypothetical protein
MRAACIRQKTSLFARDLQIIQVAGSLFLFRSLKHRYVALSGFYGRANHRLVLNSRIVLRYRRCGRAVEGGACASATRRVMPLAGLRRAVGIPGCGKASEYRSRHLPVLFLLDGHFIGDAPHWIVRAADVPQRFDPPDAEINGGPAKIVDANHEHRATIALLLSRSRANKDDRVLLARDQGRLPVAHQFLLLRIRWPKLNCFGSRYTAAQRGA